MGALAGKVALVTGASRGIGRAVALRLAREGAGVYLAADGTEEELEAASEACRRAGGAEAAWGRHDLTDPLAAERMVEAALARFGGVDILVNNAGLRCRKAFGDFTHEDFDRLVGVNLRSAFFAGQAVLPAMRGRGGGHIVHIASQLGIVASRYGAVYNLTKAALIQLTRAMALELAGEGIAVNAVSPGPIETEGFLAGRHPGELEQRRRDVPAGRFGTPEEVAAAVAFLVSGEAGFFHGHNLVLDGGYVIH